jgi:hypothetical protein
MSNKSWKDHLLSSGVPLEYSVRQMFEDLGIDDPGEYHYERKTPEGVSQVFSVDVHSRNIDVERDLRIECLVECKYRHDGTRWVFMPRQYGRFIGPDLADLFVTLDQCCVERELDRRVLANFEDKYPLCTKGIELLPEDANPKTIEQALQQLRYAVVAKALDSIDDQLFYLPEMTIPIEIIIPIIVTTAELWRLKVGVTIEEVRSAKDITDIGDRHDVLVLHQQPDHVNMRDTKARFNEWFNQGDQSKLDDLFRQTDNHSFRNVVGSFSANTPSLFIVISYNRAKTAMKNLHSFLASDRLIRKREKKRKVVKVAR